MAEKVYTKDRGRGEGIIELAGGAFEIDSFTTPGVRYKVHPESGYCSCKRFQYTGVCVKHTTLAQAIQQARELRFGSRIAQRNVIELCQRIFVKVDGETCHSSYDLLLETMAYRYSTDRMVQAALKRHRRILSLHEREKAA